MMMKANIEWSGNNQRRGYGRMPEVHISIEPESEAEKAVLRMAYSGKRRLDVWESGNAEIVITMPRGKNPQ
jgi:hypothetical protein